jgi:hypothetical protein
MNRDILAVLAVTALVGVGGVAALSVGPADGALSGDGTADVPTNSPPSDGDGAADPGSRATDDGAISAPDAGDDTVPGTSLVYEGESLSLETVRNATVRGESDLAPGTELDVRLVSSSTPSPFVRTATATVGDDGAFEATFDLRTVAESTPVNVTAVRDGSLLASANGTVSVVDHAPVTDTEDEDEDEDGTSVAYEGERLTRSAVPNATISGETDLEAGTELQIRVVSSGSSPFIRTVESTVSDGGAFEAAVDLVGVANGTGFDVSVRHGDETVDRVSGIVIGGRNEVDLVDPEDGNWTRVAPDKAPENRWNTSIVHEGDSLALDAATDQRIRGETDLAPGTKLEVRVRSAGSSPFLLTAEATVSEEGTFEATVDLSGVDGGTTVDVVVRHDGETAAETTGEIA